MDVNLLRSEKFWGWMAGIGLILAFAVRFYSAWNVQYIALRDYGVVLLMAKHMAELGEFPVFYYGQAYMGSLEPALSALLCKLFGTSEYAICAGTALWSCSVPVLVYLLTRDAAGRRAGFFAVVYLIISSDTLLHFSSQPRGGYMTMLMFGLLVVLMVNRFTARALTSGETSVRHLAWAGLFAGLGWWNNQMVIVFLMAAVVVVLPAFRFVFRRGAILWALAAFLLGSLPWWWWNFTNDWESFAFSKSFGRVGLMEGLGHFFELAPKTLGLEPWPTGMNMARLAGLILLGGGGAWALVRAAGPGGKGCRRLPFITMVSAGLIILFMALFFSHSHYSRLKVTRYLMPLIPAMAILVGVAVDWLVRQGRVMAVAGVLLFVLVVPRAVILMPKMDDNFAEEKRRFEATRAIADFLQEKTGGVAVGDFLHCWVTFATRERAVIADMPVESYAPYARQAALAPVQAFINNFHDLGNFLAVTRAGGKQAWAGEFLIDYDFRPPSRDWAYLPADQIESVRKVNSGQEIKPLVADGNLDTQWVNLLRKDTQAAIEWVFTRPVKAVGLRVMGSGLEGFDKIDLEGRTVLGEWIPLIKGMPMTGHFWSGPRVFYQGLDYFQECRFVSPETGITALRLGTCSRHDRRLRLPEISILEAAEAGLPVWPEVVSDRWTGPLQRHGIKRLYAPRWLAERLHPALAKTMHVRASSYMSQSFQTVPREDSMEPEQLKLDLRVGLIVGPQEVSRTRHLLAGQPVVWQEEPLHDHTLFVVEAINPTEAVEPYVPLYWTECGLFGSDGKQHRIDRAYALHDRAGLERDPATRLKLLERAVWLAPEYERAVEDYGTALRMQGRGAEAEARMAELDVYAHPALKAPGQFPDRIKFLGVNLEPVNPRPGGQVAVTYHWQCRPRSAIDRWSVFVHFRSNGKILFQDDHSLMYDIPKSEVGNQPFPLTFRSTRLVKVPETVAGEIEICVGLVDPKTGKQAALSSPHELRKSNIVMPLAFKVE